MDFAPGSPITDRVDQLCQHAFSVPLQQLLDLRGKDLTIIGLDQKAGYSILLDGSDLPAVREYFEKTDHRMLAAYISNWEKSLIDPPPTSDVLILTREVMESRNEQLDALILHELVHAFIAAGWPTPDLDEESQVLSNLMCRRAIVDTHDYPHDENYCALLAWSASHVVAARPGDYLDAWQLMRFAMADDMEHDVVHFEKQQLLSMYDAQEQLLQRYVEKHGPLQN